MGFSATALILLSSIAHVYWNVLVKRSAQPMSFVWTMHASSALLCALGALAVGAPALTARGWGIAAASGACHALYQTSVAASYKRGDLSSAYPIARGLSPILAAIWGVALIGELPSALGWIGIVCAAVGVLMIARPELSGPARNSAAVGTAAATAVFISFYSLLDKAAATVAHPLSYLAGAFAIGSCIQAAGYRAVGTPIRSPRSDWAGATWAALASVGGYVVILVLYRSTPLAYVVPARSVSVLLSVLVGGQLLGERQASKRWPGAILILAGVVSLAFA